MSLHAAFRQAILENPEDDTPRLVYADWLDEHGDPVRAEFVRTQIELARLPEDNDRRAELTATERRLYVAHSRNWGGDIGYCRFARGFVEQARFVDPYYFPGWAPAVFAEHPITDVWFSTQDRPGWGPALAERPELARLRALRIPGGRSHSHAASDLIAVAHSPHLAGLETLNIGDDNRLNDTSFARLIGSGPRRKRRPAFRALRRLAAHNSHLSDAAVRAILDSPLAGTLTHLTLEMNDAITPAGLKALWESPLWGRLEEADIGWLSLDDAPDYAALVGAIARSKLLRLSLGGLAVRTRTGEALVQALAAAPSWGPLRALELTYLNCSGAAFQALVRCPHFADLTRVDLRSCDLNADDFKELAASPHARNLTALNLEQVPLDDQGLKALAESPYLTRLHYLNIAGTSVTDTGIAALVTSPNAAHLRVLNLHGVVGSRGLRALAESPQMRHLTTLWINYTEKVDDAAVVALARSPHLRHLTYLDLHAPLSEVGRQALLEATHMAWPGVAEYELSESQREQYSARFDRYYGYEIEWDEPFFDWMT